MHGTWKDLCHACIYIHDNASLDCDGGGNLEVFVDIRRPLGHLPLFDNVRKICIEVKAKRKLMKNFLITQCSSLVMFIELGTFLIISPQTANSSSNLQCKTSGRLRSVEGWELRC